MASKIDPELAKSLIQEFRNQNKLSAENSLKTPEGQHLHGFFIDRESLESILQDKDNVGLHVYLAKHPDFAGKPDNVHTLAMVGAKLNIEPNATTPYVSNGDVYDQMYPCPPYCSNLT